MNRVAWTCVVLLAAGVGLGQAKKKQSKGSGPERWEPTIAQFEAADKSHPPTKGGILLVGGSNARRWTDVADYFPGHTVINRGFGGARMDEVLHYFDRIVLPYEPKVILLNAGGNDLAAGRTPEEVQATGKAFVAVVRKKLPGTKVIYISVPPTVKAGQLDPSYAIVRKTNDLMRELETGDNNFVYIDLFPRFLDAEGKPKKELYVEDGTHFTQAGQKILADLIKAKL